ncbi:hypothetical protein ACFYT4_15805 [Streptomyces sp. NPDC004609]|uniref:hypothetical protein n=1 Tax=Streptomyces sp. NPDC004609 TaxID=3364704 RepID=UPI0036BABEAF
MGTSRHASIGHTLGAFLAVVVATGCTATPSAPPPATTTPAPQKTSLADICTNLVAYWAKEALKGGKWAGLDWEQKGLSNEQYDLHEEVVAAARAEERRRGRTAALALIDARTRQKCAARNGATGSSENWRPPR